MQVFSDDDRRRRRRAIDLDVIVAVLHDTEILTMQVKRMLTARGVHPAPAHRFADAIAEALGVRPRAAINRIRIEAGRPLRPVMADHEDAISDRTLSRIDDKRAVQLAVGSGPRLEGFACRSPVEIGAWSSSAKRDGDRRSRGHRGRGRRLPAIVQAADGKRHGRTVRERHRDGGVLTHANQRPRIRGGMSLLREREDATLRSSEFRCHTASTISSRRCSTSSCIRPPEVRLSLAWISPDVAVATAGCLALHAAVATTKASVANRWSTLNYTNVNEEACLHYSHALPPPGRSARLPRAHHRSSGLKFHAPRIDASSAGLVAFLNRAPERPFTRCSHSFQVRWRIGLPSTTLR